MFFERACDYRTEDWNAPAHWWSFQGSKLSAAAALSGIEWGSYIIPRAAALQNHDVVQRVATIVGSGGKGIIYYNFGPEYMFPVNLPPAAFCFVCTFVLS